MEIVKKEKGITLVALIITVIVLLILAVVTISSIQGDGGVVKYAQDAADDYTREQGRESDVIQKYTNNLIPDIEFKIAGEDFSVKEGTTLAQFIGEGREIGGLTFIVRDNGYIKTGDTLDSYIICRKVSIDHADGCIMPSNITKYVKCKGTLELTSDMKLLSLHEGANSSNLVESTSHYSLKCDRCQETLVWD